MTYPCQLALISILTLTIATAETKPSPEQCTEQHFDSIRQQPPLLLAFLRELPKGGDLHNHLLGAIYAESYIDFAVDDGLCVDRTTSFLIAPPCDASCDRFTSKPAVRCAYQDRVLYNSIVDAWSMRNWSHNDESGHDHFFTAFDKSFLASLNHIGDAIAEAASRAAEDNLQYVEFMHTADGMMSAQLGAEVSIRTGNPLASNEDFAKMRESLLSSGLHEVTAKTSKTLNEDEAKMRAKLDCGKPSAKPGCVVQIRYLYQVLRGLPKEQVFAQIVLGFELASADPRFVGLNLVMPEDWYVPMHDFDLHMHMLDYLHSVYPKVHISLHAGELAMGLVPPEGLRSHIRESIELGHAERIGHGVSVMNENDAAGLLETMAQHEVLVEICLTSNDAILGVAGDAHPLSAYLQYGVPVALATDDEGVSRSDMTYEYLRAVLDQGMSYADLKRMARQSLEHSFLPGESLWADSIGFRQQSACANSGSKSAKPAGSCQKFLDASERATTQWRLEQRYADFEQDCR